MIKLRSALVEELLMRQSDYILTRTLAADTHEAADIPDGARYCIAIAESVAYAKVGDGTSFSLPTDVTDGTSPVMLPANTPRLLDLQAVVGSATKKIGLRAAGTPKVTLEFFA